MINPNLLIKQKEISELITKEICRKKDLVAIGCKQKEKKILFIREMMDLIYGNQDCLDLIETRLYDYYETLLNELINGGKL